MIKGCEASIKSSSSAHHPRRRALAHADRENGLQHPLGHQPYDQGRGRNQFHTIVCWDRLAETTTEYVKKGDPLYGEGQPQHRSFQDEEGNERGTCEIVADDVQFLSRRSTGNRGEPEA
jgi:single stranded DNA-binding protein